MVCSMLVPHSFLLLSTSPKIKCVLSLSVAGAMLSSGGVAYLLYFAFAYIILHLGWVCLGGLVRLITSLLLRTYYIFLQLPATLRYHWIDATSQELLYFMLRYVAFSCAAYTTSSYVEISLNWCYVTRTSLYFMLRCVAFSCASYTTSSYVEISLNWCYVTRTSVYFMLRYVAFSCASYTTSSYVKISLNWCYVTRTSLYFMLRYVAFSCPSYTTSRYVEISLNWCYVTRTSLLHATLCYAVLLSLVLLIQLPATLRYHWIDDTSQELHYTSCYAMLLSLVLLIQTSSYVEISLNWCYVKRTSLDFMLRYVAFSCASYTTSSYVEISLNWCYVTRTSVYFMLRYVMLCCLLLYFLYNFQLRWDITELMLRHKNFCILHAMLCRFLLCFLYNFKLCYDITELMLRHKNFFILHATLCCFLLCFLYNFQLRWDITELMLRHKNFFILHATLCYAVLLSLVLLIQLPATLRYHFKLGKLAKKRSHDWKAHGPKSMILETFRNTVFFVQESIFIFPCSGIARFRAWNPVIYTWNGTCEQRKKKKHKVL